MVNIFISDAVTVKTARNRPAIWRVRTSLSEVCLYHSLIFIYSFICLFIYLLTYYSFNFPCFIQSFVCLICLINLLIRDLFIFTFFFIHLFIYISCQKNYKLETSCIVFLKYVHVTDSFVFSDLCNNRAVVHLILQ